MNKNDKYEYFFFRYMYKKLNLDRVEKYFEENGVKPYDGQKQIPELSFSKYFSLLNQGSIENFSEEENKFFNTYFDLDIFQVLENSQLYGAVEKFMENTYNKYFFGNLSSKYKYYGPATFEYMAPSDAVSFGINYLKFKDNNDLDNDVNNSEKIICDTINSLQNDIIKKYQIKAAFIPYNEISLNRPFVKI